MAGRAEFQAAVDQFADWRWRLNNLYWITDKEGKRTLFKMNWAQEGMFENMHFMNLILKARQLGFTTFIQLFMLDACVWNTDVSAGTIAHTLDDAKTIFRTKVKFPYDHLPEGIRQRVPVARDNATELMLGNNSSIRVGTSLRSGTLQYLHVSEYGKLCAKFPEKAREVRTGALNTVQAGQVVFIESTAEGQEGDFYTSCERARAKARTGAKLTPLDFKFHFYAWHQEPGYAIDPDGVVIGADLEKYFAGLAENHGIELTAGQKAWYAKKAETQLADMKREYPSTADEAFEASIEGAYYGELMAAAELRGRVGAFPAVPGIPVHAVWDIGVGDYTAIWFFQVLGGRPRCVGYLQGTGEGMPFYIVERRKLGEARGWIFGRDYFPHDGRVKEWGTGRTRLEQALDAGLDAVIVPLSSMDDGINAARMTIAVCEFDAAGCAQGLLALKAYRKEWDEERGIWLDRPRHDWASHGADAYRYLSMAWRDIPPETITPKPKALPGQVYLPGPPRPSTSVRIRI